MYPSLGLASQYPTTNTSQKKFTCESTGHTGFTFFEAKESEVRSTPVLEKGCLIVTTPQSEASKEINSILPEALRSRILEYVQFDTTSRIDDLGKLFTIKSTETTADSA
jgi:hypothetical protein